MLPFVAKSEVPPVGYVNFVAFFPDRSFYFYENHNWDFMKLRKEAYDSFDCVMDAVECKLDRNSQSLGSLFYQVCNWLDALDAVAWQCISLA